MTIRRRLRTLESRRRCQSFVLAQATDDAALSISDELTRDDPERIALFLAVMQRAGFLDRMPSDADESNIAEIVRLAVSGGFVSLGG